MTAPTSCDPLRYRHPWGGAQPAYRTDHRAPVVHAPSLAMKATGHPALIPHKPPGDRRQHPPIPATAWSEAPLTEGIAADPRSARKRHDRPVTPEVAGSSPVAPVKNLQIGIFCRRSTAGFSRIPHRSRTRIGRESPPGAARSRESTQEDARPTRPEVGWSQIQERCACRRFAFAEDTVGGHPARIPRFALVLVDRARQPAFFRPPPTGRRDSLLA
jgi:hypothetical protein